MTYMEQNPYQGQMGDGMPGVPQKTSAMAITGLVFSLLCCIPTTVLGALLGLLAIFSIKGNPAKKGTGIAVTALVLGVLFSVAQVYVYLTVVTAYFTFRDAPYTAMQPGFDGDIAAFRQNFAGAGTDEEAQAFIDEARSRYGDLLSSAVDFTAYQGMQQPAPGQTEFSLPWTLNFENATVVAHLTFSDSPAQNRSDTLIFDAIQIKDAALGDLVFPLSSADPDTAPMDEAADVESSDTGDDDAGG